MIRKGLVVAALIVVLPLAVGCSSSRSQAPAPAQSVAPDAGQWRLDWADGTVFYEIFVRSFADSNGDGIGDFRGLTAKLDYLNDGDPSTDDDLGIGGIWLMPIFPSPSYHGYDVVDYYSVNPDYGSMDDFRVFIAAAHARGIRVVIDLVINHTGRDHPWFRDSASGPDAAKRDWYVWRPDDPGWTQPWGGSYHTWHELGGSYYYGIFWGGMPDLNLANPAVRAEVIKIARFWLDVGVDGFRLDAARHLFANGPGEEQNDQPETHAFWREFAAAVRESDPEALLIGENWTDTETIATYYGSTDTIARGDELPMNFDFPMADAIVDAAKTGSPRKLEDVLDAERRFYPEGVLDGTFITNHDMVRIASEVGGDPARLKLAASLLLTLPGSPFVYYGEELGMTGTKPDPDIRTPMQWTSGPNAGFSSVEPWHRVNPDWVSRNVGTESRDPDSLLTLYRRLIHLRDGDSALAHGKIDLVGTAADEGPVFAYLRSVPGRRVLVVHNLGTEPARFGPDPTVPATSPILFSSVPGVAVSGEGGLAVDLPPGETAVIEVESGGDRPTGSSRGGEAH